MGNLPYGATKGALDRLVIASARELAHLGMTANVVNPGPVDTGWMDDALREGIREAVPARPGRDAAGHRRTWCRSCAPPRAAGSTASCSARTAACT